MEFKKSVLKAALIVILATSAIPSAHARGESNEDGDTQELARYEQDGEYFVSNDTQKFYSNNASFKERLSKMGSTVVKNSDGSYTISSPRVRVGTSNFPINWSYSLPSGICKYYGLHTVLARSSTANTTYATVDGYGRITDTKSNNFSDTYYTYRSITCS